MADLPTRIGPATASPVSAAPPLLGVAAALFAIAEVVAGVGGATGQAWLVASALLLASTISVLALLPTGFAAADLVRHLRSDAAVGAIRSGAVLLGCLALVAAPAWTLLVGRLA